MVAGCTTADPEATAECLEDRHCQVGQVCASGKCVGGVPVTDGGGGAGGGGERCRLDDDCQGGRCVDGECFASTCTDGEERACTTACGEGFERCRGGVFRPCTAPNPVVEVCGDARDNDCDRQTDEDCGGCTLGQERPCMTECGAGVERCLDGAWYGCSAARVRPEICGTNVDEDCDGQIDESCQGCNNDARRPCESACGVGTEVCVDDAWRGCNAPAPSDEVCNGKDDDCDSQTDEETVRDCTNACGSGLERCVAGAFSGCTAPENCACSGDARDTQVCDRCGVRQRACNGENYGEWDACVDSDRQCEPGDEQMQPCGACGIQRRLCTDACQFGDWQACKAEGVCQPGEVETEACGGGCGSRERRCTDQCGWGPWAGCEGMGGGEACAPGQQDTRACGNCGTQTRACAGDCTFGEWGPCTAEGECRPGDEQGEACAGACSARVRACTDECRWGDFGACSGGGQCTPGATEDRACGQCGRQERSCDDGCVWSDWNSCSGEGACDPGDVESRACGSNVGQCRRGTETRTCSGQCGFNAWGACLGATGPANEICGDGLDQDCSGADLRQPDGFEPNDSCDACRMLEETDPNVFLNATHDSVNDRADFYCFTAVDNLSAPGFGEHIRVDLLNIPNGTDYDIYLYRSKATCRASTALERGVNSGSADDHIDWTESINVEDGGVYVVEVRRVVGQNCARQYRLEINGLN